MTMPPTSLRDEPRAHDGSPPYASLLVTLGIGLVVAVALTVVAAEVYDAVTDEDGVAGLDEPLLAAALRLRQPWLNVAATAFTDVAGVVIMPIIAIGVMLLLAIRRRSWTPVILITAAAAGSLLMTVAGKEMIGRVRPDLADAVPPYEHSPSFPSGHTLNAVVIAGIVAYLVVLTQKRLASKIATICIALVFAVTVGATRVYLGHHWFTDVLAAFLLGLAWLALVITAHRVFLAVRARRREQKRGSAEVTSGRAGASDVDPATTTLAVWLERLAEPQGAPGGGAVSAVLTGIAAALLGMVAAYTEDSPAASASRQRLARIRGTATRMAEDDGIASAAFGEALAMDDGQEREAALRPAAIDATRSSLGIGELAASAIPEVRLLSQVGNPHLEADRLVAVRVLEAALRSALITAEANLDLLTRHRAPEDGLDTTVEELHARARVLDTAQSDLDGS